MLPTDQLCTTVDNRDVTGYVSIIYGTTVQRTNRKPHLSFMQEFNIGIVRTSPLK